VHAGPRASRSRREVITRGLLGQWACFPGDRAFSRDAPQHLRTACPTLPHRTQFTRLRRRHDPGLIACCLPRVDLVDGRPARYEALESSAVPPRDATRRGGGWWPGLVDIGWRNRLGWDDGVPLLMAVNPRGVITGFGFGPASTEEQALAETCFAVRQPPDSRGPSVGRRALGAYLSDQGFARQATPARWWHGYGAQVSCPPKRRSRQPWSTRRRRWLAGVRQIVETVDEKVHHTFRRSHERPHALTGFQARLAAKMTWHTFCIWLNEPLGRPRLAVADLVDW